MLITASEMKALTEEAIESEVMKLVDAAAKEKSYEAIVSIELVPDWLIKKLWTFGYIVERDEELELITIRWGQEDAE